MNQYPHTTVILAMTADGKIADKVCSPARFGSTQDKAHLEKQVALADGVMFGAGTLRAYGTSLPITDQKLIQSRMNRDQSWQPTHIVASASGKIDPQYKFFQQSIPRWLLTTKENSHFWQSNNCFDRVLIGKTHPQSSNFIWEQILVRLKFLGIGKLAVLGGGELVASLFAIGAIDEIWLTVCPVIFGGIDAPTPVMGNGWLQSQGIELDLLEAKQVEGEVFLHYKVIK